MPVFEFQIAIADVVGTKTKYEGDVINIKPFAPTNGRCVMDEYLCVPVECDSTINLLRRGLLQPYYEGGLREGIDFRSIQWDELNGEDTINHDWVMSLKSGLLIVQPEMIGKRRYSIPLNVLGNIDLKKTRDKEAIYQPFKKASGLVGPLLTENRGNYKATFNSAKGKYTITNIKQSFHPKIRKDNAIEVDCAAAGITDEQVKVFTWESGNDLVYDKFANKFISPSEGLN